MNRNLQPGSHLDPDQLSMLVDGTAGAHERDQMLAHMGECAECRRVVFLLQNPTEPEAENNLASARWTWRRWAIPIGLAGAALACSLTMAVYLLKHRGPGAATEQNAQVHTPTEPPNRPAPIHDGNPEDKVKAKSETVQRTNHSTSRRPVETPNAKPPEAQQRPPRPGSDAAAARSQGSPTVTGGAPEVQENSAETKAADAARTPAPVPQTQVAEKPTASKDATESPGLAATNTLPPLRIEHDRGPEDGMSQVTGRVTDTSGAIVSGAQISLRDSAGTTREAISAGDGTFTLAGVPPGHYELQVTARGFETNHQAMDLKPRDLAMLDSVLSVGASTETVAVESGAPALNTESASVSANPIAELPSHLPAATTVTAGKHVLSLDDAGALFVSRNGGKSWKKVKPHWAGKVAQIETTSSGERVSKRNKATAGAENAPSKFRLTTDSGAVWTSDDGMRWRAQSMPF